MKVALAHQGFATGDAIGNDIAGMYRLLEKLELQPVVICDWHSRNDGFRMSREAEVDWRSFDLIIYHHSQYWQAGDELLRAAECPIIFKYHNITPAHFFQPYHEKFYEICQRGKEQTKMFLEAKSPLWLTDSNFNKVELIEEGADLKRVHVVPPFNQVDELLRLPSTANYRTDRIELLFVGRIAPNKGHLHLLRVLSVLVYEFRRRVRLRIVGLVDPTLKDYHAEIDRHIRNLRLENQVEIHSHCHADDLLEFYRRSHIYLCLSEHEGFNVPIIESQAIGLPVLGAAAGASAETAGANQLFSKIPASPDDDGFYAALVEKIFDDKGLRAQLTLDGEHNVLHRFTDELIENAFVNVLYHRIGRS